MMEERMFFVMYFIYMVKLLPKIHKTKNGNFFFRIKGEKIFIDRKLLFPKKDIKKLKELIKPKPKLKAPKAPRIRFRQPPAPKEAPVKKDASTIRYEKLQEEKLKEEIEARKRVFEEEQEEKKRLRQEKLSKERITSKEVDELRNKLLKEEKSFDRFVPDDLTDHENYILDKVVLDNEKDLITVEFVDTPQEVSDIIKNIRERREIIIKDVIDSIKKRTGQQRAVIKSKTKLKEPKSDKAKDTLEEIKDDFETFIKNKKKEVIKLGKDILKDQDEEDVINFVKETLKDVKKADTLEELKEMEDSLFDLKKDENDGSGKVMHPDGLSNTEIDKMMGIFPEFMGTISHDEIKDKILPQIEPQSRGCFVINTDIAGNPGKHWQACFFDARPGGDSEIDFFDSFGDPPSKVMLEGVKGISNKLNANTYLKFKENMIKKQNDSNNCGFHSIKFLIDRMNGKPFTHASGFDDHVRGENNIEKFKKQMGYGEFKYVKSPHGRGILSDIASVIGLAGRPTNQIKNWLRNHGQDLIQRIKVYRDPINQTINGVLNVATRGKIKQRIKKLGYDKLYHLYSIMQLRSPSGKVSYFRVEKTSVVEAVALHAFSSRTHKDVPVTPGRTLSDYWNRGIKRAPGQKRFYTYNHLTNNCQIFLSNLFQANGWWNSELKAFILQDAEALMEDQGLLNKFAEVGTDIAGIAENIKGKVLDVFKPEKSALDLFKSNPLKEDEPEPEVKEEEVEGNGRRRRRVRN